MLTMCVCACHTALAQVDPKTIEGMLPAIASLNADWVNKVAPALTVLNPTYLVEVVTAIAPGLQQINPDQLVALLPAVGTISVSTWQKLIELLNKLTAEQVRTATRCMLAATCMSMGCACGKFAQQCSAAVVTPHPCLLTCSPACAAGLPDSPAGRDGPCA